MCPYLRVLLSMKGEIPPTERIFWVQALYSWKPFWNVIMLTNGVNTYDKRDSLKP